MLNVKELDNALSKNKWKLVELVQIERVRKRRLMRFLATLPIEPL